MSTNFDPVELLNKLVLEDRGNGRKDRWLRYFEPIPELSHGLPAPILGVMVLIWQLRQSDLAIMFPLEAVEGRLDFLAWCAIHGRNEYRSIDQATLFNSALDSPYWESESFLPDDPAHAISVRMYFLHRLREDLKMDLNTETGRRDFLLWYLSHGQNEIHYKGLEQWQLEYLNEPAGRMTRLANLLYNSRPDLQQAFPFPEGIEKYLAWFKSESSHLEVSLKNKNPIFRNRRHASGKRDFGVNVVGYAYGQLGIGEDARMAVKSLLAADVPVALINFKPGALVPQSDVSMAEYVQEDFTYSTNIFCLTALEHGRCFAEFGIESLQGTFNIGYWPWELPEWPRAWVHLQALVDEVWLSSQHTFDSFLPVSKVPTRLMPMAVDLPQVKPRTRSSFGLPETATLFIFSFDLKSSFNRKNPLACINAFLLAFPLSLGRENVGLVIKVHPPEEPSKAWEDLKSLRELDSRIYLIEETLDRQDLLALYSCCDCFISLHRAEGFGRGIAEAMLLGKPVIVTAYSGNADFTNSKSALLTKFDLVDVPKDGYPFSEGQMWAEPDIDDAARQMLRVADSDVEVSHLALRGHIVIDELHSPGSVGKRYANVIRDAMRNCM